MLHVQVEGVDDEIAMVVDYGGYNVELVPWAIVDNMDTARLLVFVK